MTRLIDDDALLDDLAAAVASLRAWLMIVAERHPEMDTAALDRLLERYTAETGRRPGRPWT
jgi:hypothetical protein